MVGSSTEEMDSAAPLRLKKEYYNIAPIIDAGTVLVTHCLCNLWVQVDYIKLRLWHAEV